MKIGIITVAFNEEKLIGPCIEQFGGFDFPHIVLVSTRPWRGNYYMDNTWLEAEYMGAKGYNVHVYKKIWANQAEQFNYGLDILEEAGYDWALIVDADEFYTPEDIGKLVGEIRTTDVSVIRAPFMDVYWKTPCFRITPEQNDRPIIAVRTNERFVEKRQVNSNYSTDRLSKANLHHMSYVRTDEDMKKKIETFEHSHEFDTKSWYNVVWLNWSPEKINLHPVVPNQFERAVFKPAPDTIRALINWNTL